MRANIDDNPALCVDKRVGGMEDVAGFDIAPDDAVTRRITPQHADARGMVRVPCIGEGKAAQQALHGEGDG